MLSRVAGGHRRPNARAVVIVACVLSDVPSKGVYPLMINYTPYGAQHEGMAVSAVTAVSAWQSPRQYPGRTSTWRAPAG